MRGTDSEVSFSVCESILTPSFVFSVPVPVRNKYVGGAEG